MHMKKCEEDYAKVQEELVQLKKDEDSNLNKNVCAESNENRDIDGKK